MNSSSQSIASVVNLSPPLVGYFCMTGITPAYLTLEQLHRPKTSRITSAARPLYPSPLSHTYTRAHTYTHTHTHTHTHQTALQAATSVGCGTVLLADRPANVTQHSMGAGLAADTGLRLIGSAALTLGSLVVTLGTSLLPDQADGGVLAAGLAAAVAVVAPVVGPFIEVSRFADMNEDQIEEAVAVREPLDRGDLSKPLKLFGEDALLDWPGAFQALIPERDAFMAKAIAAVATGKPGVAPAYVFDEVDGKAVWRYAMPEDGPQRSAPQGLGDGALMGLRGVSAVVGVVGSAHVRGMVRDWPEALQNDDVSPLLADAD
ncbi:hypothetical protein Vretimale_14392 [Volvox reticuliferus]|uniref:Uncharacterized protein n=1 Tax=Volvox reticuliferus TaxID=1737510 RepID=A0A8J4CQ87_9CHLO|nr:hypothetical protein Vretifemale_13105 [Volvox reticuliferus]GIM11033.1 hypothetical protein Vretimale_14392 [Volvox reticuliferus]